MNHNKLKRLFLTLSNVNLYIYLKAFLWVAWYVFTRWSIIGQNYSTWLIYLTHSPSNFDFFRFICPQSVEWQYKTIISLFDCRLKYIKVQQRIPF